MRFSIIVPIFRVEKYITQCIDSILFQSYSDYELILVDDGSDDNCPHICDYYAAKHSNIIVVHKKNGGLVSARKAGASKAHGDYILNIDGDDWIEYDYLEMISSAIDDSNYADIIIWGTTLCRNNSRTPYKIWKNTFGLYTGESVKEISHRFLYDKNESAVNSGTVSINLVTKAVKTQLYREQQERVNNNVTKGEDALLSFYLLQKANSILYLDYYGYNYRYVEQSMSNCVNEKDFIILSDLVTTMKKTVDNERILVNQVSVYALWRIMGLLAPLSKIVTFREFKKTLNTVDSCLFEAASESVVYNKRLKDSVKLYLIRHRLWFAMYLILKRM